MAVGREGSAVECSILEHRLRDLARLEIDDLNALLAPTAEHDHGSVLFRREYKIDRQAAQVNCFAGGIESHAGRQRRRKERLVLGEGGGAQQCRKRESKSINTERKHNRRSSRTWHNIMTYCRGPEVHQTGAYISYRIGPLCDAMVSLIRQTTR